MRLFFKKVLITSLFIVVCLSGCKKADKEVAKETNKNRIYYTETDFIEDDGSAEIVTDVDIWNAFYKYQKDKYGEYFSKIKSLEYILRFSVGNDTRYVVNDDLKNYHVREYSGDLPGYSIEAMEDSALSCVEYYIINSGSEYWVPYDRVNDKTYVDDIGIDRTLEFYDIALNVYDVFKNSLGEFISDRGEYGGELYTLGSYYKYVSSKHPMEYGARNTEYTVTAYFDENYDMLLALVSFPKRKDRPEDITTFIIQDITFDQVRNPIVYSDAVAEELERQIEYERRSGAIINQHR